MKKIKKQIILAIEYSLQNPTISITQVSKIFNVDRHAISKYKKNNEYLNYNIDNASDPDDENLYYFSEEELNFIQAYLNNPLSSYDSIKQQFSDAPERRTLYRWLAILGKNKTEGKSIKYHYDRNKFKNINTEEDAYWLGFITADGCIIENRWLQIQLAEKDKGHIIKFCKYMGLNGEETEEIIKNGFGGAYTRDNPICNLKICSLEIINNLLDKGIKPHKSGQEKPYICNNIELERAYIRGLIDGDGFLGSTQKRFGIVGSYEICSYVQNYISKYIKDINKNRIREHGTIYKLEVTGNKQSSIILSALYENANIYLDRKYELYLTNYQGCRD